jgi:hypothetical protein
MTQFVPTWKEVPLGDPSTFTNSHTAFSYKGEIYLFGGLRSNPAQIVIASPGYRYFILQFCCILLFQMMAKFEPN